MTEAVLETFVKEARESHRSMGSGELFDWILHNLPEKVPQKRIRACLTRLGLDKLSQPKLTFQRASVTFQPAVLEDSGDEDRKLRQRVVQGLRPERPETADELREMFDPRD